MNMEVEFQALNYKLNDVTNLLNQKSTSLEDDKENKRDLFQSQPEKTEKQLENKRFESPRIDNPHHCGFNLLSMNYFIHKVELKEFDGTYVFTWMNQIDQFFELHNIMDAKQIILLGYILF